MNQDIQTSLDAIKAKLPECQLYIDYYGGQHRMAFATDKFQSAFGKTLKGLHDNLCPIVIDAPADRMEVINFSGDDADKTANEEAWALWQRETLELLSNEVHKEALKCGAGYLIVWKDEDNKAKFYNQDARQCCVIEDEDTGKPLFGAKQWTTKDKHVRLNLYYADRIEKYITANKRDGSEQQPLKAEHFVGVQGEPDTILNPYNIIPMFKFEAWPLLNDAIPIQDALNKTFSDRLVTQEFGAFRQRWITGFQPEEDPLTGKPKEYFNGGIDKMWFASDGVKFGDFQASEIKPYLEAADSDRLEMARVTGTPLHFFSINTSDAISGEALKTLESRFTKKVSRLCLNFGTVWARAIKFALQLEGVSVADNLTTQWESPEQRSEKETLECAEAKQRLGVAQETIWEEIGYTEEDIKKFTAEKEKKQQEMLAIRPAPEQREELVQ